MATSADGNYLVMFFLLFIYPSLFPKWPWSSCWSDGPFDLFLFSRQAAPGRLVSSTICPPAFSVSRFHLQANASGEVPKVVPRRPGWEGCRAAAQEGFSTHFSGLLSARTAASWTGAGPDPMPVFIGPRDCGRHGVRIFGPVDPSGEATALRGGPHPIHQSSELKKWQIRFTAKTKGEKLGNPCLLWVPFPWVEMAAERQTPFVNEI